MKSQLAGYELPAWVHARHANRRGADRRSGIGSQLTIASVAAGLMLGTYALPSYAADTPMEVTVAAGADQKQLQLVPASDDEVQTMAIDAGAAAAIPALSRDKFSVTAPPPPPPPVVVKKYKPAPVKQARAASAPSGQSGRVIWPVGAGVRMSDGFGPRRSPCSGCSSEHKGLDMLPGAGTPILSIAGGTVRETGSGGGYGVYAIVEHVIGGQRVDSLYAHMQWGSLAVSEGQTVSQGQRLGRVGNTGASTGAHLHLEIRINDVPVDPLAWLRAND